MKGHTLSATFKIADRQKSSRTARLSPEMRQNKCRPLMRLLSLFLLFAAAGACAGESVVLTSGSRLHAERHEIDGDRIRLYSGGGYIEMEAARVQGFEADEPAAVSGAIPNPTDGMASAQVPVAASPVLSPQQLADAAADKY